MSAQGTISASVVSAGAVTPGTSVKDVRGALPTTSRDRSTAKGIAYFVASAVVYWASFVAIALPSSWPARLGIALLNGFAIGAFFVVGHDACHGSLTPRSGLNRWLGRIAFLPSLQPYAAWEYSHNALHHGWTNLRGKDPVYAPRSLAEYRALPRSRQRVERLYRTWPGLLPLYLLEIWWALEMRPSQEHRQHLDKRGSFQFDRALVLAFPLVEAVLLAGVMEVRGGLPLAEAVAVIAVAVTIPFLAFSWLIGFATFQHHTHPRVIWYGDAQEWNFFRSQVQGTVHVVFPRWVEVLLHNIMEHTAHHVDMKVPLYNLTDAQRALEAVYGPDHVITEPFTFAGVTRTFRACQLYDYEQHRWLTFAGQPTTEPRDLIAEAVQSLGTHLKHRADLLLS